jgi:hypothetical protein
VARPRKKASIDDQLRALISQALEEKQFIVSERLMEILKDRHVPAVDSESAPGRS